MDGDDFLIFMAPKVSFKSYQHLFPSLAHRFACCQSCSVSLRTLWAYGFDSAAQCALEKSKVGEKEKYFISFG